MAPIPKGDFVFFDPHPYVAAGASYGVASPWMLRKSALHALKAAQEKLQSIKPGWKIMIFDAYRPNAVQAFMVEREFTILAQEAGLGAANLTPEEQENISKKVFRIWGIPSENPATPPLHSTGGATDVTLADEQGKEVNMGSPIDENSDRSNPDYFKTATDETGKQIHKNRELLKEIMTAQGFCRLRDEWWHFSFQDQYWAWREREEGRNSQAVALYGRADLLEK